MYFISERLICIFLTLQMEVAQILVEAGAWVDLRDDNGDTPLLLAARSGQAKLAEMLLSKGVLHLTFLPSYYLFI